MSPSAPQIRIHLVGAGPGDPGLITARALELIGAADVIFYDRLIPAGALDGARAGAELVYVGKEPGVSGMTQNEINARLVARGREGLRVVRLKGGDPFLFGRGAEEAQALREAGLEYEVAPGVTAGIAAPAYAGIPVTCRGDASAVAFVTGHEDPAGAGTGLDHEALAAFPGTLVFYMGVGRLAEIAAALIEAGRAADEPAALIEQGTTPGQRVVTATLSSIAAEAQAEGIEPPALIVTGDVVARRERLAWFERRPLSGRKIVVTRARPGAAELAGRLRALGAEVVELPLIRIEPRLDTAEVDRAIAGLGGYDLICLTSPNGVDLLFEAMEDRGLDARALAAARIAVVGPGTAAALEDHGIRADLAPERSAAEGLVEVLGELRPAPDRVLLARAAEGRRLIPDSLQRMEIEFEDLALYETVAEMPGPEALDGLAGADWITFSSGSAVNSLIRAMPAGPPERAGIASIGPVTSGVLREAGLRVDAEAARPDLDGLIEVLLEHAGPEAQR